MYIYIYTTKYALFIMKCIYHNQPKSPHTISLPLLTLGAHAQEGYGSVSVCVSVCYHSIGNIRHFYAEKEVRTGLS